MKAAVMRGGKIVADEIDAPKPAAGEVLVKAEAGAPAQINWSLPIRPPRSGVTMIWMVSVFEQLVELSRPSTVKTEVAYNVAVTWVPVDPLVKLDDGVHV